MSTPANPRGFSLIELLVSLTLTIAFAAVLHTFSRTVLHGAGVLAVASESQEAARIGIQLVTRDLRGAGFHARGGSVDAIRFARADSIGVSLDLNGDGDVSDTNERIAYAFNAEKGSLTRTLGDGSPQPMLNDLAANGLHLSYFDASGRLLPMGETGLGEADRTSVRRIDVTLRIESRNPDPASPAPLRAQQTGTIWLRNG